MPRLPRWPRHGPGRAGTPRLGFCSVTATPETRWPPNSGRPSQRCESLRDNLWYLVDSKVATAIAVDDRTQAQRQAWLAAAAAVTTGAGDRPSAEEVIRQQVEPYVNEDIRNDWLTTMRSTLDGVATSYDMVTDRMAAAPATSFEFPGDLGPVYQPLQAAAPPSTPTPPAAVAPAACGAQPAGGCRAGSRRYHPGDAGSGLGDCAR